MSIWNLKIGGCITFTYIGDLPDIGLGMTGECISCVAVALSKQIN